MQKMVPGLRIFKSEPQAGGGLLDGDAWGLTFQQRLYGFLSCVVLGALLSLVSLVSIGRPVNFAMVFTLGNVVSLAGSAFIWGPSRQWKSMLDEKRRTATACYLLSMVATVTVACWLGSSAWLLVLALVALQWVALVWYSLSYIPYGRTVAKTVVMSVAKSVLPR